jgi:hypothetical protein
VKFDVIGEPVDNESTRALAIAVRYQFQYWALSLVAARPEAKHEKKGANSGVDGVIYILEGKGAVRPIMIQVKSGHVTAAQMPRTRAFALFADALWTKPDGCFADLCLTEQSRPLDRVSNDRGLDAQKSRKPEAEIDPMFRILI